MVLLRGGLTGRRLVLGVGDDSSIRVQTANDAVGFGEDLPSFLDQGLDVLDELFLVKLLLWSRLSALDFL